GHMGLDDLDRRTQTLARQVRDNGITYNVYASQGGPQRPWALDLFPLILTPESWRQIEVGVQQRARLLERVMADVGSHDIDAPSREQLVAELPFARVITFVDEGTSVGAYKDSPCHPYRPRSRFSSLFRTVRTREWIGGGIRAYFERTASIRARTPGQPRPMPS
ncbi:MAG: hypothetical protein EB107_14985, partial [Proteobacteria bacterium]|nr:hypothetical protein [Pseudomonadota bacterium]